MKGRKETTKNRIYAVISLIVFLGSMLHYYSGAMPKGLQRPYNPITVLESNFLTFFEVLAIIIVMFSIPPVMRFLSKIRIKLKSVTVSDRLWTGSFFIIMLFLCSALSALFFHHLPHVPDTAAQLIHARIFASGHLYVPSHPLNSAFDVMFMINDGKYYSQYPPAHTFLWAIFLLLGAPWLLNPLMGALTGVLVYYLAMEVGNRRIARLSSVLFICSLYIVIMFSEYMNHATAVFCTAGFTLFFIRAHKNKNSRQALLAGLFLGGLLLTRPQVAVYYSIPYAAFWIVQIIKDRSYLKAGMAMAGGAMCGMAIYLLYNYATTGNMLVTGYQRFANLYPVLKPFAPNYNVKNIQRGLQHLTLLHERLFFWHMSSLIPIFLLFFFRLGKNYTTLMIMPLFTITIGMTLTTYTDVVFYPRYLFEMVAVLIPLTAMLFIRFPAFLKKTAKLKVPLSYFHISCTLFLIFAFLSAGPLVKKNLKMYSNNYLHGNPKLYAALLHDTKKPALILHNDQYQAKLAGALFGPPDDSNEVIAIRQSRAKDHRQVMEWYSDRYVYRIDGNNVRLVRLPISKMPAQLNYTPMPVR